MPRGALWLCGGLIESAVQRLLRLRLLLPAGFRFRHTVGVRRQLVLLSAGLRSTARGADRILLRSGFSFKQFYVTETPSLMQS